MGCSPHLYSNNVLLNLEWVKCAREYSKSKSKNTSTLTPTHTICCNIVRIFFPQALSNWVDNSSMLASHSHSSSSFFHRSAALTLLYTVTNPSQWNDNNIIRCTVNSEHVDWAFRRHFVLFCRFFISTSLLVLHLKINILRQFVTTYVMLLLQFICGTCF